jgi:hypothetical protein
VTRREYAGAAAPSYITSTLGGTSSDVTIYCNNLTNWPDGVTTGIGPFFVVIDRGTANEEKILCSERVGNTLTVVASTGRGSDDTTISAHSAGAVIEHVFTATDADEANYHVNTAASTSTVAIHGLVNGSSVVGTADAQTLTNKTLSGAVIANGGIIFEGSTVDNFETTLSVVDPTADQSILLPNASGTVAFIDSPAFTGTPTAPTAAATTDTTQIATTAYVKDQKYTTNPAMNGSAAIGSTGYFSDGGHIHPTDTSRAPIASPTFTGTPAAPTAATTNDSTQIATTAYVKNQASVTTPLVDGTASVGTAASLFALGNHVHPTDTSRAPIASPTFTGTPDSTTPSTSDDSTRIATTAYVRAQNAATSFHGIKRGTASISISGVNVNTATVNLGGTAFSSTPVVVAVGDLALWNVAVDDINYSSNNFLVRVRSIDGSLGASGASITINWIALGAGA